jgi:hypothetical protein
VRSFGIVPAALALAIAAGGCAHQTTPQEIADATTRAVYDADYGRATARFDDGLKAQITRASFGDLSDRLHALGAYHGLKTVASDPDRGRYDYDAAFDKGTMLVQIRLAASGQLEAYRVSPESASAPR